ncbi:MAG TPA: DUF1206 domain-containing protein [Vicinamibacterales bacterium]|nr:DUF1206 domain-containing protein [Vicinamibacterales bacterium]
MPFLDRIRRATRPLAILGCISIGTVYVLVGTLALLALSGRFQGNADEERMVHLAMDVAGGAVVVWGIVAGLAGYVAWRIMEVVTDPQEFGNDWKGILHRAGIGASALAYGAVAWSIAAIAITTNDPGGGGNREASEQSQQMLIGQVLEWPAGAWLVGAAGVAVIVVGVLQFVLLARRGYTTEIALDGRSTAARRVIHALAWYGYAARGVILCVLGYFLVRGAMTHDPSQVGDTDTAFDFIGGGAVGDTAFFVVAVGTIAYGLFMYANARYYHFGGAEPRRV